MGICVLSAEEVGRLKHYGLLPSCESHHHMSHKKAMREIAAERMDIVEGLDEETHYITPAKLYVLQSRKSGHIRVIQRVIGTPMKHITPPSELDLSKE